MKHTEPFPFNLWAKISSYMEFLWWKTSGNEYIFFSDSIKWGEGGKEREKKSIDYELLFYYSTFIITLSYVTFGILVLAMALY